MTSNECTWFDCREPPVIYIKALREPGCHGGFCLYHWECNMIRMGPMESDWMDQCDKTHSPHGRVK